MMVVNNSTASTWASIDPSGPSGPTIGDAISFQRVDNLMYGYITELLEEMGWDHTS
jgi:hypothetical protein